MLSFPTHSSILPKQTISPHNTLRVVRGTESNRGPVLHAETADHRRTSGWYSRRWVSGRVAGAWRDRRWTRRDGTRPTKRYQRGIVWEAGGDTGVGAPPNPASRAPHPACPRATGGPRPWRRVAASMAARDNAASRSTLCGPSLSRSGSPRPVVGARVSGALLLRRVALPPRARAVRRRRHQAILCPYRHPRPPSRRLHCTLHCVTDGW